jgi:signal transduction histidine kinase
MRFQSKLSNQLLAGFGLSLFSVGLLTLGLNYRWIQHDLQLQVQTRAQSITQGLQFSTEGLIEVGYSSMLDRVVGNYASLPDVVQLSIVDPDGKIISDSLITAINRSYQEVYPELAVEIAKVAETGEEASIRVNLQNKPVIVHILPFSSLLFDSSQRSGLAIAIINLQKMKQEAREIFLASTVTLMVALIAILLFMGILIHRIILNPLLKLHQAVNESRKTGHFILPVALPENEISFLATTFDQVLKKLSSYEQLQQEIQQRQQAENSLRAKSELLEKTLKKLRTTQSQLIHTEKMSSLGQMVAGIAHEINNPVNFIHGNIDHVLDYCQSLIRLITLYQKTYPQPTDELTELIEEIDLEFIEEDLPKVLKSMDLGTTRIKDIVLSLRNFSRLNESEIKKVALHEGLESTLLIVQNRLHQQSDFPEIKVIKNYGNLPMFECYPGQLNQVFLNILNNAIDVLKEVGDRGDFSNFQPEITISTWLHENYINISIKDNGSGMSPETQQKIFDPFFTTKPVGKGTGLGLSIAYQIIVDKHKGQLSCISEVGKGTEFIISIPLNCLD